MSKLKHRFTTDLLFKQLFKKNPHLLKQLVSQLLKIPINNITQFEVRDTEIPPATIDSKYCRLDILMTVESQQVNLEVQVDNRGDFLERALFYWARIYSGALPVGGKYVDLPRTIIISIVDFIIFDDFTGFHSEFQLLEVTRNTPLIDKQVLHFFELPKLPKKIDKNDLLLMWLALFKAGTEEDLKMIEGMGVDEISEVVTAYRTLSKSPEFREMERLREKAEFDEASALRHARDEGTLQGEKRANKKWQAVVADKDAELEALRRQLTELQNKQPPT